MQTGYLAPEGLEEELIAELTGIQAQYGRLILAEGAPQKVHWAQNIWHDPQIISFQSLSEAAKKLRQLQKLWAFYPYHLIRKGKLISEQLPFFAPKPLPFPAEIPKAPLGSWMLLDETTLLASPHCSSPFAHGEVHFQETKVPPSRAYLKLWEAFTRIGCKPKPGDLCLDLGASPGSWTWALQELGARVIAVDRSPLALEAPHTFLKGDAFSLEPKDLPKLNWIFSDLICYPEKLFQWLEKWHTFDIRFICTLKFQGKADPSIIQKFESKGKILRLFHNKHELTWTNI